jgi:hypothetical protein
VSTIPLPDLLDSILTLLTEAYAGPPDPSVTWFIDNAPDSGILGILAGVTAEEASRSVDGSREPGTTIASHAEHLRWSLAVTAAELHGQPFSQNWAESWQVSTVDPEGWDLLRGDLRSEYENVSQAIKELTELSGDIFNDVLALLPHAAYHLGNIRQMIERVRS